MSAATSGSWLVTYDLGTMCVPATENLERSDSGRRKFRKHEARQLNNVPVERLSVRIITEINEKGILPDVGRKAFQLKRLESCPSQQRRVRRSEFTQVFDQVFVRVCSARGLLFCP